MLSIALFRNPGEYNLEFLAACALNAAMLKDVAVYPCELEGEGCVERHTHRSFRPCQVHVDGCGRDAGLGLLRSHEADPCVL